MFQRYFAKQFNSKNVENDHIFKDVSKKVTETYYPHENTD